MRKTLTSILGTLLICILGFSLVGCGNSEPESVETIDEAPRYRSPYNFANLQWGDDGRFYYYIDDKIASRIGIDVSEHNKYIDWDAVATDDVDFAFIRLGNRGATEGTVNLDDYYNHNIENAQRVGIDTGVYFFSQALNADEAREEAEFVLEQLGSTKLQYPIVFDHEPLPELNGRADNISSEALSEAAEAFCDTIKNAGYDTMIYGNRNDVARFEQHIVDDYDFWFAEYNAFAPSGQFDFTIWQYTDGGSVAGIETSVDMNIHFLEMR